MGERESDDSHSRAVVGRIGRAHGIRGEVSVEPRTDEPGRRFAVGNILITRAPDGNAVSTGTPARLTIESVRWHQERLLVRFAEGADRTAVEGMRGTWLEVDVERAETPEDPEEFYDHQLIGLRVTDSAGTELGTVTDVEHSGGQDLLHIRVGTKVALFPFVTALVPTVDIAAGLVVVDDRPGLLRTED